MGNQRPSGDPGHRLTLQGGGCTVGLVAPPQIVSDRDVQVSFVFTGEERPRTSLERVLRLRAGNGRRTSFVIDTSSRMAQEIVSGKSRLDFATQGLLIELDRLEDGTTTGMWTIGGRDEEDIQCNERWSRTVQSGLKAQTMGHIEQATDQVQPSTSADAPVSFALLDVLSKAPEGQRRVSNVVLLAGGGDTCPPIRDRPLADEIFNAIGQAADEYAAAASTLRIYLVGVGASEDEAWPGTADAFWDAAQEFSEVELHVCNFSGEDLEILNSLERDDRFFLSAFCGPG